ncbi:MAG TPA: CPBP family intramembrane glutamic endopeptidase [Pseudogracilibacillus sp.]|nr:CPBP family intramembrane glutamic endopeptidase [Pseudogracilibacillus sp.]
MESKWRLKLVFVLTLLGAIGIIAIIPYEITTLMNNEVYQSDLGALPLEFVIIINTIVRIVLVFIFVLFGLRFQRRTGLNVSIIENLVYQGKLIKISKLGFYRSIIGALLISFLILIIDVFVFSAALDNTINEVVATIWWQGLFASFYGGITEELMLRLFAMTCVVWLLAKITKKHGALIPNRYYYLAIILTSLLFALGHIPATIEVFGELTPLLFFRTIVYNGLLGLWFGYVYFERGLEYAMIAHFSADIFIHVLMSVIMH